MTNESAASRHVTRSSPLIGCRSPLIVVSPPPLVTVDQTFTFVINCTAMGIPTPQVQNIIEGFKNCQNCFHGHKRDINMQVSSWHHGIVCLCYLFLA